MHLFIETERTSSINHFNKPRHRSHASSTKNNDKNDPPLIKKQLRSINKTTSSSNENGNQPVQKTRNFKSVSQRHVYSNLQEAIKNPPRKLEAKKKAGGAKGRKNKTKEYDANLNPQNTIKRILQAKERAMNQGRDKESEIRLTEGTITKAFDWTNENKFPEPWCSTNLAKYRSSTCHTYARK